jgi:hypothetical protein
MRWKIVITRAALLVAFVLSGCMFSATIDVTGHWAGTLQYTTGPAAGFTYPIALDLIYDNRDLTGTITLVSHGTNTFELPINSGQARSSGLHIDAFGTNPHVEPSPTVSITLEGQVDAATMSGDGTQVVDGVTYEFTWEASFVPTEGGDQ